MQLVRRQTKEETDIQGVPLDYRRSSHGSGKAQGIDYLMAGSDHGLMRPALQTARCSKSGDSCRTAVFEEWSIHNYI